MNAREQEKADLAKQRRHEGIRDTVIEAIGELLSRRARYIIEPEDFISLLGINRDDYCKLGEIAVVLNDDEKPARLKAAFLAANDNKTIQTVEDLATEIEKLLDTSREEHRHETD